MSCTSPLAAYRYVVCKKPLKYHIHIFKVGEDTSNLKERYGDDFLMLPCGHCDSCRLAYRKDWAVRCEMESMLHRDSCFVTLTLDDEHVKPLPLKADIQYFLHKLRDSYGIQCRYFACGELGSRTGRSHYHMILFGYMPDDLKFFGLSKAGFPTYTSKFLKKVWNQGDVYVNDFDFSCAAYVAGYVNKEKKQCFLMESRRPGLGHDYMVGNLHRLFKYGNYQGKNGQVHRLPRYFDKICDQLGYDNIHIKMDQKESMEEINKAAKFNKGILKDYELNWQKGVVMKDKLKKLKRGL